MKDKTYLAYKIFRPFIETYIKLRYKPIIVNKEYIPKEGPIIICGNHLNFIDSLLVGMSTKRMINFLAKKEYHDNSFTRPFFKIVGTIPVDRNNQDPKAKEKAKEVLNSGGVIGIFPEGTRNRTDNNLLPFKFGAVSLAKKTNAKIVPFAITGARYKKIDKLKITFSKPFEVGDMSLEEANEKLKNIIEKIIMDNK